MTSSSSLFFKSLQKHFDIEHFKLKIYILFEQLYGNLHYSVKKYSSVFLNKYRNTENKSTTMEISEFDVQSQSFGTGMFVL